MKNDRLFGIVHYLLNKKSTAGELAARFGVSKRTILRDINTLSLSGVPICTTSGNGGGVSLIDGYVLDKTVLSDSEREQILIGLKTLAPTGHTAALDKLESIFAATDYPVPVEIDYSRWGAPLDKQKFELVKTALSSARAISFAYPASTGEYASRTAYPLKLLYKSKSWYVQAYCLLRDDYRTFKINRMENVSVTDEKFDARDYSPPAVDAEIQQCETERITATFTASATLRVRDEFYPNEITINQNGTITVETDMPINDWVCSYFLSFGDRLVALSPDSLRNEVIEKSKIMLDNLSNMT